jgi:hypothetical protein
MATVFDEVDCMRAGGKLCVGGRELNVRNVVGWGMFVGGYHRWGWCNRGVSHQFVCLVY